MPYVDEKHLVRTIEEIADECRNLISEEKKNKQFIVNAKVELIIVHQNKSKIKHVKSLYEGHARRSVIRFKFGQNWLEQLVNHHKIYLNDLKASIEKQTDTICSLDRSFWHKTGKELSRIVMCGNGMKEKCQYCRSSILPCSLHQNNIYHIKTYYRDLLKIIPVDKEIAIDTESVALTPKSGERKHENQAFRVSIVANTNHKPLIYHAWIYPSRDFKSYSPVTGISVSEIKRNKITFEPYHKIRKEVQSIINDRIVVVANLKSEILALGLSFDNPRDIQEYYKTFNIYKNDFEPKGLDWLSRNVLLISQRSGGHDPSYDNFITLKLYNLIPKEFWNSL